MEIVIPGTPVSKKRPRFYRRGKFVGTYNDQETEEGKALLLAMDQITEKYSGPVTVYMHFFFVRPKTHYGTGKNSDKLKPSAPDYCTNSKDLDNLVKFYLDIFNGVAFDDDRQVYALTATKSWSVTKPETIIIIEAIE